MYDPADPLLASKLCDLRLESFKCVERYRQLALNRFVGVARSRPHAHLDINIRYDHTGSRGAPCHTCIARTVVKTGKGKKASFAYSGWCNSVSLPYGVYCAACSENIYGVRLTALNGNRMALVTTAQFSAHVVAGPITGDSFCLPLDIAHVGLPYHENITDSTRYQPDAALTFRLPIGHTGEKVKRLAPGFELIYFINASHRSTSIFKFVTHSSTPNCYFRTDVTADGINSPWIEVLPLRDLEVGETITIDLAFDRLQSDHRPVDVADPTGVNTTFLPLIPAPMDQRKDGSFKTATRLPNHPQSQSSHSQSRAPNKVAALDTFVPFVHEAASIYPPSLTSSHTPSLYQELLAHSALPRTRATARRTNTPTDKSPAEQQMFDRRASILAANTLLEPTDAEAATSVTGIIMPPSRCTHPDPDAHPGVPQCTNLTQYGHLCPHHLASQMGLRIGPSLGKGVGVFATRPFGIGDTVGVYTGDKVHRQPGSLFPAGEYMLQSTSTMFINAARTTTSVMRNANDGAYLNADDSINTSLNNCVFDKIDSGGLTVNITTTRAIAASQEVLLNYSADYWTSPELRSLLQRRPAAPAVDLTVPAVHLTVPASPAHTSPRKTFKIPPAPLTRPSPRTSPTTPTHGPRQTSLMSTFKTVARSLAFSPTTRADRTVDNLTASMFDAHVASVTASVTDLTHDSD